MKNIEFMGMLRSVILFISILLAWGTAPVIADPVKPPVQRREIPAGKIDQYRGQRAFQYNQPPPKLGTGLWSSIRNWIFSKIGRNWPRRGVSNVIDILKWIVPSLILVFAVVKMFGMDQSDLLRGNNSGAGPGNDPIHDADIHLMDFERSIAEAVGRADYREAVRLQYLQTLKQLTDRGYVRWQAGKTNADYIAEISSTNMAEEFASLTHVFEYAWYGELPVNGDAYTKIEPGFRGFRERLAG